MLYQVLLISKIVHYNSHHTITQTTLPLGASTRSTVYRQVRRDITLAVRASRTGGCKRGPLWGRPPRPLLALYGPVVERDARRALYSRGTGQLYRWTQRRHRTHSTGKCDLYTTAALYGIVRHCTNSTGKFDLYTTTALYGTVRHCTYSTGKFDLYTTTAL